MSPLSFILFPYRFHQIREIAASVAQEQVTEIEVPYKNKQMHTHTHTHIDTYLLMYTNYTHLNIHLDQGWKGAGERDQEAVG
jgi:hypothetical protein